MRQLLRNAQKIHYKNYTGKVAIIDSEGNKTGEYELTYGSLKEANVCVSSGYGVSRTDEFGQFANYDRTISCAAPGIDISEQSIVWIDASTSGTNDYIVTRISRWKNSTVIAVKKVDTSGAV